MLALLAFVPAWLDASLAGYLLANDETRHSIGVSDPKTGYYLLRTAECDGAYLSLTLTRDRKVVAQMGFTRTGKGSMSLKTKPLPSLRTGKGIAIGAAPDAVRARLGAPSKIEHSGPRGRFLDYVYALKAKKSKGITDEQRYIFKAGRLIEVSFFRDSTADLDE